MCPSRRRWPLGVLTSSLSVCLSVFALGDSETHRSRSDACCCLWALHEDLLGRSNSTLSPEELIRSREKEFNGSLPALGSVPGSSINRRPTALRNGAVTFANPPHTHTHTRSTHTKKHIFLRNTVSVCDYLTSAYLFMFHSSLFTRITFK